MIVNDMIGQNVMQRKHTGIPTSRAAAVVVSKDMVVRDQFYNGRMKYEPAAVVLRLAPTWFRIGSLEILAKYAIAN